MMLRLVKTPAEIEAHIGNAVECVIRSMQPAFESRVRFNCVWLGAYCDSPIEVMLAAALQTFCLLRKTNLRIVSPAFVGPVSGDLILRPQYEWQTYRSDFCLTGSGFNALIECDGHDFHERTKQQAEHDRRKDRAAQAAGFHILRFTGSEIYRDAFACALQILAHPARDE